MTDPLDALRTPVTPVDPGQAFAERLRGRIQRALLEPAGPDAPEGAEMIATSTHPAGPSSARQPEVTSAPGSEPAWGPTLTPYILVPDARRALDWYVEVLGAERRGEPYVMPDGSVGHAELGIGDAVLMLAEYAPDPAGVGPTLSAHSLFVSVTDTDETVRRAVESGAELEREPADESYGRTGVFVDPFGHRWMINTRPPSATQARPGGLAHLRLHARDEERLREFYRGILGSRVLEHGIGSPGMLILGEANRPPQAEEYPDGMIPIFRVSDVNAAVAQARAAGGEATEPRERRFGPTALVTDPEDNTFEVWQPPAG